MGFDKVVRGPKRETTAEPEAPVRIFLAYAEADDSYRRELEKHLATLMRKSVLLLWHERMIAAGADWQTEVNDNLKEAEIILLLVSADFLDSKYCVGSEIEKAVQRHTQGRAVLIPILVRPCMWTEEPFSACDPALSPLPSNGRAVSEWKHVDQAFLDVVEGIHGAAKGIISRRGAAAPKIEMTSRRRVREYVDSLIEFLVARARAEADGDSVAVSEINCHIHDLVRRILPAQFKTGSRVAGTQLIAPIGRGGFATVWSAKRLGSHEIVATKVFHFEHLATGLMLWRFRRGIQAIKHLIRSRDADRSILPILSVDDSGLAFSMPLVERGNLQDIASRGWTTGKQVDVAIRICRAVERAHRLGVIHRDIKPANILLDSDELPILTDFDIADVQFLATESLLSGGEGTPLFTAPEQLKSISRADERSDGYSLGRLLYFMLLGRPPAIQHEQSPSLGDLRAVPLTLVSIVRKATQYDPAKRYATVAELRRALETYLTWRSRSRAIVNACKQAARKDIGVVGVLALILIGWGVFAFLYDAYYRRLYEQKQLHLDQLFLRFLQTPDEDSKLTEEIEEAQKDVDEIKKGIKTLPPSRRVEVAAPSKAPAAASRDPSQPEPPAEPPTPSAPALSNVLPLEFAQGKAVAMMGIAAREARQLCGLPDSSTEVAVLLTFRPDGTVEASIGPQNPHWGTVMGGCIEAQFELITVPPFTGDPVKARKTLRFSPRPPAGNP
jgi:tRNA A-37 threonylcarbamoyl transferase component Bud32